MELLYLYVDAYRNFKSEGFNFSNEFLFTTSIEDQEVSISVDQKKFALQNFFVNKHILNVTAIIGQNGTGKSNILEFIRDELAFGQGIKSRCIVAIKDHDDNKNPLKIYFVNGLKLPLIDRTNVFKTFEIDHNSEESKLGTLSFYPDIRAFYNCSVIYYSNIFDLRYSSKLQPPLEEAVTEDTENRFNNISTLAILDKDHENYASEFKATIDKTDAYKVRELGRNIQFITTENRSQLDFKLPNELVVTILEEDKNVMKRVESSAQRLLEFLDSQASEFSISNESGQVFINRICRAILFNYFKNNLDFPRFQSEGEYLRSIAGNSFMEFFFNFFREILKDREGDKAYTFIQSSIDLVDFLFKYLVRRHTAFHPTDDGGALVLNVTFEGKDDIGKFLNLYINARPFSDFLTFYWRGLSSGEQSMLTLFSRFHSLSDSQAPHNLRLKDHLLILIDEGDVYFHPEWQRKYLELLISFLPKNFGKRKIQLILTSNTPYLASDLPKSNILFLRKDKLNQEDGVQYQIAQNPDNDRKETFASNIHTLLSNSFYLENGLVGSFAEKKINEVIGFIKNKNRDISKLQSMKNIIEIIGEPVIKNRLKELWIREFGVDEEIEELEKKINELKLMKKKRPSK
ncbi:AAA family ATPase [Ohtaekwangia koreensis]|uniref:AAA domain-containing protein, putative AbiEii toxin, Type IV TA system n=1 Tax=Ohtaekwangia koreensis TaxID=688867 RepID=A0A1T5J2Y7_9BACT|nr:AAA family ATPase [Ohtaekwangia koreensis]SKC45799.1 AAA domain-containing protein, putative AbiEii toxin, Type IV TA system [Ohtaekwangia koreensis]